MLHSDVLPGGVVRGRKNPLHYGLPLRLKRARTAAELSRRALAERAGVADGVARYIEDGKQRAPGVDTVERLARGLGVSPCWLAYGDEGPLPFLQKRPQAEQPAYQGADVSIAIEGGPLLCEGLPLRLQAAREARGLSRRALGKSVDMSTTAIGNIEDGRTISGVATVEKLAAALDVAPCWLAYGQGAAAP